MAQLCVWAAYAAFWVWLIFYIRAAYRLDMRNARDFEEIRKAGRKDA